MASFMINTIIQVSFFFLLISLYLPLFCLGLYLFTKSERFSPVAQEYMTAQCVQIMSTAPAPARRHDERLLQGVFLKKKKKSRHASYDTPDTKRGLFLRVHEEKHKPECIVSTRRSLLKHSECFCLSGQHTGARLRFYPKKKKKKIKCSCNCFAFRHT